MYFAGYYCHFFFIRLLKLNSFQRYRYIEGSSGYHGRLSHGNTESNTLFLFRYPKNLVCGDRTLWRRHLCRDLKTPASLQRISSQSGQEGLCPFILGCLRPRCTLRDATLSGIEFLSTNILSVVFIFRFGDTHFIQKHVRFGQGRPAFPRMRYRP